MGEVISFTLCSFFWDDKGPPLLKDKWLGYVSRGASQMPPRKGSQVDLGMEAGAALNSWVAHWVFTLFPVRVKVAPGAVPSVKREWAEPGCWSKAQHELAL